MTTDDEKKAERMQKLKERMRRRPTVELAGFMAESFAASSGKRLIVEPPRSPIEQAFNVGAMLSFFSRLATTDRSDA